MEAVLEQKTDQTTNQMVNRSIKKVAILGSGVMGSRIACHFANIGCDVVLLDIVPFDLKEEEKDNPAARNRLVNTALQQTLKSKPAAIYSKSLIKHIKTGNFTDNMDMIADADWILEAVIERLDIKKQVFEQVEKHRKPGTIISSNTSGIPIHSMLEERSEDFRQHFIGTHFFNPPRYLRLLEIIPTPDTKPEVVDFLMKYGSLYLGKTTVHCKDTPAFIANRIGMFSMMTVINLMDEMDFSLEEIDMLTGTVSGRPRSATFRTADVVGLDTMVNVANNLYKDCPDDDKRDVFQVPDYVKQMLENKWLGDKTGQGFYKKSKDENGKRVILALDRKTMEYVPKTKPKFDTVKQAKSADNLRKRLRILHKGEDQAGEFYRQTAYRLSQYVSNRIPEIAEDLYKVDDALKAGFAWDIGPFEVWDALGVKVLVEEMEAAGHKAADWVYEMLDSGAETFYKSEGGKRLYYSIHEKAYKPIPGTESFIILDNYREKKPVWSNSGATLHDIGDGVLNLEFHTKMNAIGSEILQGMGTAIDIAEKNYRGLVIGNDAQNFSAGANIAMMLMLAIEQEFDELDLAVRMFQGAVTRMRFSSVPVVAAPHGLTLGGGCELTMHCDAAVAAAETYIGLVEMGAGLIPAGGGTKEFALRASDSYFEGDVELPTLQKYLLNIAQAKVATSAQEAMEMGVLQTSRDRIVLNQDSLIAEAKKKVIALSEAGYTQPAMRTDIKALGQSALGSFNVAVDSMYRAGYISEHDGLIARKAAYVICGGDLTSPQHVSEQYLLDLEREAFLSLLGERKTLERMQAILTTGKPLRN